MEILVTGNVGFVGSNLTEYLLAEGHHVTGIDKLVRGSNPEMVEKWQSEYPSSFTQYTKDLCDIKEYLNQEFDIVINLCAESCVDDSINGDEVFIQSNIVATKRLLDYCVIHKPKVFVQLSSDEVMGTTVYPAAEYNPLHPENFYAATKASQEMLCHAYKKTHGLNIKITRCCNIIGKYQADTKILPRLIDCIKNDKEFPVYDGGTATREYVDVRDVCYLLSDIIKGFGGDIINITYNQELSILQLVAVVSGIMGKQPKMIAATRKGHDLCYRQISSPICMYTHIPIEKTIEWILDR